MVADEYCVVRPVMVVSVLNTYTLLFPEQYSITASYMALNILLGIVNNQEVISSVMEDSSVGSMQILHRFM